MGKLTPWVGEGHMPPGSKAMVNRTVVAALMADLVSELGVGDTSRVGKKLVISC